MPRFLFHTLFLLAAVILAFFWTNHPTLSPYTLQLVGAVVLFFFLNQFIASRNKEKRQANLTIDAIIFTMVILLLVISSGSLTSPLFFLVYFLMFGLSLLFEPLIVLPLTLAIILFFALTPTKQDPSYIALQLFSLLLITPLALFFGSLYLQVLEDREKIKILEAEEGILEEEIGKEETDILMWASLEFKKGLGEILEQTADLLSDLGHLTLSQKERILKIREQTLHLRQTGEKLKEEIDKTTDEQ
jgi:hypothetical protein